MDHFWIFLVELHRRHRKKPGSAVCSSRLAAATSRKSDDGAADRVWSCWENWGWGSLKVPMKQGETTEVPNSHWLVDQWRGFEELPLTTSK